ncbi:hypothetical protein A8F94_21905 [Bacillus sp. FJAT-27225]|uniref:hypothetical protein n=1 Tax=Bacillus sp. FJAT-27225 TaxID=1743144 RepID=UPI00080C2DD6|nr:hypothetical protein [Bacillus sp. FJAT-27225]OCA81531.1 hypothetical protein A8F94_21905 [Bacillus sp. FJAT-27225]
MTNMHIVLKDNLKQRHFSTMKDTETWILYSGEADGTGKTSIPIPFESIEEERNWAEQFAASIKNRYESIAIFTIDFSDQAFAHMLALKVMQRFPSKTKLNPIIFNKNDGMPSKDLNVFHHLHQLLQSGNYRAAGKLATGRFKNRKITQMLELAQGLRQFDFTLNGLKTESYWTNLTETLEHIDPEEAASEIAFIVEFRKVQRKDQRAFITYLFNYAELLYKDNNLVDFVVLYYRLAEETLLYALGWDINWAIYDDQKQFQIRRDAEYFLRIPANERLTKHYHRYLKVLEQEIYRLNGRPGVIIRPGGSVGLDKLSGRDEYFAMLYLFFKEPSFSKFLDLRHQGVSGHGFADFNKADFEEMLGGAPLEKIAPLLGKLGLRPDYSIFGLISKAALALAAEEVQKQVPLS